MTQFQFSEPNEQFGPDRITLTDETGRSLPCSVERTFTIDGSTYLLLLPLDVPVAIIAWDSDEEAAGAVLLEDSAEIDPLLPDAKAVLAEQNLVLKDSAYTLTVEGEIPTPDEEEILTLEIESDGGEMETDEFQFLASFYNQDREYEIYTPLSPLLFFAKETQPGRLDLAAPEEFAKLQPLLEEFLFD